MKMRRSSAALEPQMLSANSNQSIPFETGKLVIKETVIDVQVTTYLGNASLLTRNVPTVRRKVIPLKFVENARIRK